MIVGLRSLARLLLVGAALCARQAVVHADAAPEHVEAEATPPEDDSPAIATDQPELPSPAADSFFQEPVESEDVVPLTGPSTAGWGRWRARVGTLLLNRSNEQGSDLSTDPYGYFSHSNSDFLFPTAAAVDAALRYPGERADVDFRYFGVLQSTSDLGPRSVVWAVIFDGPSGGAQFWSALSSSLQSAELNLRRDVTPNLAFLGGFRYVQFREALLTTEVATYSGLNDWIDVSTYDLRAQNELFGLQLGAEGLLWSYADRLRVETSAKAGIYGNAASSGLFYQLQFQGATTPYEQHAYRGNAAFVGDVAISGSYQIARNLALRGGYQLLWLSGVAIATEQSQWYRTDNFRTFSAGDVFFHGAMVGLEGAW